ncbi:MAG TPA: alpha/beta fold hydrolase [Acetobacteraceae bacterium]|jgi:pimeloyl-ACP methyl ester carboxylesterase|nr:alpha/beta fold hydrolase [Acetobacteraceae bacterium]
MILAAREAGSGTPLVLLHGLFGASDNFGRVQRRLAGRFRTIALDLRNHGASPHAPGMDYATLAADVIETLDARAALPAVLVGHSMGGKAAMMAALTAPEAVARLVVVDVAPVRNPPGFRAIAAAMQALPLTPGLTRREAGAVLSQAVPDDRVRAFLLQNLRPGDAPSWRIGLDRIVAALPDIEGWDPPPGACYGGPTLFIAGGLSPYVTQEARPAIRALFPKARVLTLKGVGHWVHADDPEGFLFAVDAFAGRTGERNDHAD